jgi:Stress responsive A/B Barrel Domain
MEFEERKMTAKRWIVRGVAGAVLFAAGAGAGTWHERSVEAQNKFGQPKTVVHMVVYKWKAFASEDDKEQAIKGIKALAGQIPGVKNIWLKTGRNQIRDFDGVFAIEFTSAEAAADYAESPKHETWAKKWEALRENSLSFQATNP